MPAGKTLGPTGWGAQNKGPPKPRPPSAQLPSTPTLTGHSLSDELDGIFILHPALDESQCYEDRSPGGRRRAESSALPSPSPTPFPDRPPLKAQGNAFSLTPTKKLPRPPQGSPLPHGRPRWQLNPTTSVWPQVGQAPSLCLRLPEYK